MDNLTQTVKCWPDWKPLDKKSSDLLPVWDLVSDWPGSNLRRVWLHQSPGWHRPSHSPDHRQFMYNYKKRKTRLVLQFKLMSFYFALYSEDLRAPGCWHWPARPGRQKFLITQQREIPNADIVLSQCTHSTNFGGRKRIRISLMCFPGGHEILTSQQTRNCTTSWLELKTPQW